MYNSYKPDSIIEFEKEHGIILEKRTAEDPSYLPSNSFRLDESGDVVALKIQGIKSLKKVCLFPSLQELDVSNSSISKIEGLETLINLIELNLSDTSISKIENLEDLKNLNRLDFSRTSISKIEGLGKLINLKSLNLSGTSISEIEGVENLKNLIYLDFSETSITKIEGLESLKNLTHLDLSSTSITKIEGLESLKNLIYLNLSGISITKVEGLESLKNLKRLDLSGSQIKKIGYIDNLTSLVELNLSGAKIEKFGENDISYLTSLETLYIDDNPFLYDNDIILSKYRNHKDDILNLIEEQKEEKINFEYPYKVMLLGNHGAGKSSFLKHYDRTYEHKGSTHILQIFKSLKNECPKVIFYDFGGQDYYHGIYQAFFTNEALNLLFWHDKIDHNKRATDCNGVKILNFNRKYWLSQIRYASQRKVWSYQRDEDETFVIQTHADVDRQKTMGTNFIDKNAANIVNEEFFVALAYDETTKREEKESYTLAINYLKSRLRNVINSKNGKRSYPKSQVKLYKKIQERQQNVGYKYINVYELLEGYTKDILKAKLYQLYLKGEILYYRWAKDLENIVWLNPAETVKYIHTILSKENMIEEKGRISEEKMKKAFDKDPKLLRLLSLEKVVFHDEKKKTYIIPGYLPLAEEDEAYSWLTLGFMSPNFILKFESFIPFGLINQLICYYGSGENELKRYWRDQLIFTLRNEYMVWIALDFEHLMIKVHINPLPNGSKEKITQLEQEIFLDLFCFYWDRMPLQERIEIGLSSPSFYFLGSERQAIERENISKRKRDEIFSERRENPITGLYVSVNDPNLKAEDQLYVHLETLDDPEKTKRKIIGYPLDKDKQINKDSGQTISTKRYKHLSVNPELKSVKQIFVSYSKADREDLMELNKFLEDLKREEKIEVYYDETTTPGDMIHEVIRQKIIEADYVIALVSQDYISTGYIRDVELPLIKEKNKRLIPIIIKPCTWTMNEISNHYATLKGTEINFPDWNKNNHPGNYEACRAQNWTRAVTEISQKIFNNKDN